MCWLSCSLIFRKFYNGKFSNPKAKSILSVGGTKAEHDMAFQNLYAKDTTFQTFAQHTVTFVRDQGFDGLNIHWQTIDEEMVRTAFSKLLTVSHVSWDMR